LSQTETKPTAKMIDIYLMGKKYKVPEGLTILTAMEYCGYRMIRGVGCRSAFCGACGTVYNFKGDPALRFALACQKLIEPDMCLTQIPFFPASKPSYDINKMEPTGDQLLKIYPDFLKCYGCNTCTKACPQDLDVIGYMSAAIRGNLKEVTEKSFDCLMCGLCAARCAQGLVPYNIALLARRLYAKHLTKVPEHTKKRIAEINAGKYDDEIHEMQKMTVEQLTKKYNERKIHED
jgi:Fe-S-cluster-containing hydrogenase component 2